MTNPPIEKHPHALYQNSDVPKATPASTAALKQAAVLIPLIWVRDQWEVLYIRRTENQQDRHSGQVAFPGGAQDPDDKSLIDTALRETEEEIGVTREHVSVIDVLDTYFTVSDFQVTPVVGVMNWPTSLTLETREVARAFSIPLDWLRQHENLELREREVITHPSRRHPVIYYNQYDGELLWGASARMTLNFIKALDDDVLILPHPDSQ